MISSTHRNPFYKDLIKLKEHHEDHSNYSPENDQWQWTTIGLLVGFGAVALVVLCTAICYVRKQASKSLAKVARAATSFKMERV